MKTLEQDVVEKVVHGLAEEGWNPYSVDYRDGEGYDCEDPEGKPGGNAAEMVEEACGLDECNLWFRGPEGKIASCFVVFQGGDVSDPIEVIADYHTGGFGEAIERVLARIAVEIGAAGVAEAEAALLASAREMNRAYAERSVIRSIYPLSSAGHVLRKGEAESAVSRASVELQTALQTLADADDRLAEAKERSDG